MSGIVDIIKEVVFRNRDRHANPTLDGPMRPNSRLEHCAVMSDAVEEPDDIAFSTDGSAWVTGGRTLYRFPNGLAGPPEPFPIVGLATGVDAHPAGGVAVAVAGRGILLLASDGSRRLVEVNGVAPLDCPTALTVAPGGELIVCDGSRENTPDRWVHDLMEKRSSGRVLRVDPVTGAATVLADGLSWPNGVCLAPGGRSVIITEAWSHAILEIPLAPGVRQRPRRVAENLAGYPGRIIAFRGGYCLTFFALRTQLVDFVLGEDSYRRKMVERIEPAFWIAPALRSEGHYLEPVQGGGLRKHGSVKAWAPPRSYGLVVLLDEEFEPVDSLHSRVGGSCHGITGVATGGAVFVTSKGNGKILRLELEPLQ